MRRHWEYSQECFDVIKEYKERFPDMLEALQKVLKINKAVLNLDDLFGRKPDVEYLVPRIKELCRFIEKCPLSNLPYVEMGFDALSEELIQKLDMKRNDIKDKF